MYDDIKRSYKELTEAVHAFNAAWPSLVIDGKVWQLPLLQEQRTPDVIEVQALTGQQAIEATIDAIGTFERDVGQAPGTVMRLPGYFQLSASVLPLALDMNNAKLQLMAAIEAERIAQNLTPEMRPRVMRRALGAATFSTKQLQRTLHVFDGAPRRISFTWAGHTTSNERIAVAKIREKLTAAALARAESEHIPVQQTPEYLDLKMIVHLDDTDILVKHKNIAPHPRCTIWFGPTGERWDAQPKANLPVFVLAGETPMKLSELKTFDKSARGERRSDTKPREAVWAQRDMYLPTVAAGHEQNEEKPSTEKQVSSTYRIGGAMYQPS
ncbi:hypothetical protein PS627_00335 [Pseudomonas fluorescens]|uniref:DNA replication terminus site-binding protein n=1 Tax=Pseudomonas fluorescens TaxID=294 RepID=UPI001257A8F6|nr:DNA replication terminus site-binding protein [Pseudomonas fluorescens]CAG8863397.1 hypothetical protein PS627_00335 [Pseudomonas fluorescens]